MNALKQESPRGLFILRQKRTRLKPRILTTSSLWSATALVCLAAEGRRSQYHHRTRRETGLDEKRKRITYPVLGNALWPHASRGINEIGSSMVNGKS